MIKFTIPHRLPGLNEYTRENRSNKYSGNKIKQQTEESIMWILKSVKTQINKPVRIKFTWYEQTRKRDKDNVAFAKKFILDALQKSEILPNDNNQYIKGFQDEFVYRQGDKVVVEIEEACNLAIEALEKQLNGGWILFKAEYDEDLKMNMLQGKIPDDEQEILVTDGKSVRIDTFMRDGMECYLDSGNDLITIVKAWQPLPPAYKEEENASNNKEN